MNFKSINPNVPNELQSLPDFCTSETKPKAIKNQETIFNKPNVNFSITQSTQQSRGFVLR